MTEKDDLVERLTNHVQSRGGPAKDENGNYIGTAWPMMLEAATRITELQAQLKEAREAALEEAAQLVDRWKRDASFDDSQVGALEHNSNEANIAHAIRDLRRATRVITRANVGEQR